MNLRIVGDQKLNEKVADGENVEELLDVEHVDFVPVAMEPSSLFFSVSVDEAVDCSQECDH